MNTNTSQKIFCIGRNKTGTTSLEQALSRLGFKVGDQATSELFLEDWGQRNFKQIIRHCKTADAFQDIPFSLPFTYQALDSAYPGSKFILTLRNSAEEWYQSLTKFHTKIVGKNHLPNPDDLKKMDYRYQGWLWRSHQLTYGINEETLYSKKIYINHYNLHNLQIIDYFRFRPNDLLILNIADPKAMQKLCRFLEIEYSGQVMPHYNKA